MHLRQRRLVNRTAFSTLTGPNSSATAFTSSSVAVSGMPSMKICIESNMIEKNEQRFSHKFETALGPTNHLILGIIETGSVTVNVKKIAKHQPTTVTELESQYTPNLVRHVTRTTTHSKLYLITSLHLAESISCVIQCLTWENSRMKSCVTRRVRGRLIQTPRELDRSFSIIYSK